MAEGNPRNRSDSSGRLVGGLLLGIALVAIAVVGYLLYDQMATVQKSIEAVRERVGDVELEMKEVRLESKQARSRAEEAEEYARTATAGRESAEVARDVFAERALEAEREAARRRQDLEQTEAELERLRAQRNAEMNRIQRALNRIAETRRTKDGVVVNLGSDTIKFDFDRAEIKPEYREILSRIAGVLLTAGGYRVQIYGHTDDVGTEDYNQGLSERRAKAVRDYLVEAGIDTDIVTIKGFGKTNPLVPGDSSDARAKNRRVEIGIIDTVVRYESVAEP